MGWEPWAEIILSIFAAGPPPPPWLPLFTGAAADGVVVRGAERDLVQRGLERLEVRRDGLCQRESVIVRCLRKRFPCYTVKPTPTILLRLCKHPSHARA